MMRRRTARLALLTALLGLALPAAAQVDVQLVLPSAANMPARLDEWEADPTILQVILTNTTGDDLQDLQLDAVLTGTQRGEIARVRMGHPAVPRFDLGFSETRAFLWDEVVSPDALTIAGGIEDEVLRDGIPEDVYRLCVRVRDASGADVTLGGERCQTLTVLQPDPPTLIAPTAGREMDPATLQFTWTPIALPGALPTYRLVVRPQFTGQDATAAMAGNPVILDTELNTTSYLYLPSDEPLDAFPGAVAFVWQVQSLVDGDPIGRNSGLSRIERFTVVTPEAPTDPFPGPLATTWDFPAGDPIVSVDLASLDPQEASGGVRVDGAAQARMGSERMMAAFVGDEGAVLDLVSGDVLEGFVRFGQPFALSADVDASGQPSNWRVVASGTAAASGAIVFEAGTQARVTPDGLVNDGPTLGARGLEGSLGVGRETGAATVHFSSAFAMGGSPFGVTRGSVVFMREGERVALLTSDGLVLDEAATPEAPPETPETPPVANPTGPVVWSFPYASPLLSAMVDLATPEGTVTDAVVEGTTSTGNMVDVRFSGATLDPQTRALARGQIELQGALTVRAEMGGGATVQRWTSTTGNPPLPDFEGARVFQMVIPSGTVITDAGMRVTSASGAVQVADVSEASCTVTSEGLTLGVVAQRTAVTEGTATFVCGGTPTAVLSTAGLRLLVGDEAGTETGEPTDGLLVWGFPAQSPLLTVSIPTALPLPATISASGPQTASAFYESIQVTASGATLDPARGSVTSGSLRLDTPLAMGARIESPMTGWRLLPSGTPTGTSNAITFDLGTSVQIEGDRLTNAGPYDGAPGAGNQGWIAFSGLPEGPYDVTFSRSFAMSGSPLAVTAGAVNYYLNGEHIATLDTDGFRVLMTPTPPVIEPIVWAFPVDDPFLSFSIDEYTIYEGSPVTDGRFGGTGPDGETRASFQQTLLRPDVGSLYLGRIALDDGFSVAAPLSNSTISGASVGAWSALASDAPAPEAHIRVALQTPILIEQTGLVPASGVVRVDHPQMPARDLEATFSRDFAFSTSPFAVTSGEMEIRLGPTLLATVDPTGFRVVGEVSPVAAALPDRLPLPSSGTAELVLSENGTLFVDATPQADGTLLLTNRPGATVDMVLPLLDGSPRLSATLRALRVDAETYAVLSGTAEVTVPAGDARFSPEAFGVPLAPSRIVGGVFEGEPGLEIAGSLVVFGQTVASGAPLRAVVRADGNLTSDVSLTGLSTSVPLVNGSERVALDLRGASGTLSKPLGAPASVTLALDGRLTLSDGTGTVASAAFGLAYQGDTRTSLTRFTPDAAARTRIDLDGLGLAIPALTSLRDLRYEDAAGFTFALAMDLSLALRLGTSEVLIPLTGVELRETGFEIPRQEQTWASGAAQDFGPVALTLTYLTLDGGAFDWFNWAPGQPHPFAPTMQLAVTPAGFEGTGLANISATVNDATLDGGALVGDLVPWTAPGRGALIPFSGSTGVLARGLTGRLFRDGTAQGAEFTLTGVVDATSLYTSSTPGCTEPEVTLTLTGSGRMEGTAPAFQPCGTLRPESLPLALAFEPGTRLTVAYSPEAKRLAAEGTARATLSGAGFAGTTGSAGATATGPVRIDLAGGVVESANLDLGPLAWSYPAASPLFTFAVPGGRVTPEGVSLSGTGTLATPGGASSTIPARFDGVSVSLTTGQIASGEVALDGAFALEMATAPVAWSATGRTELASEDDDRVLFGLPSGLSLGASGLAPTGTASGAVRSGDTRGDGLALAFEDGFTLGFGPIAAARGRAVWRDGSTEVASFDRSGLRLSGALVAATLPATLPLPTEATAFLRLTDDSGAPVVTIGEPDANGLRSLTTIGGQSATLVLAGLASGADAPTVQVLISPEAGVKVDDAFAIQAGTLDAPLLDDALLDLREVGQPLLLTRLVFGDDRRLRASGRFALPDALRDTEIEFGDETTPFPLQITENGLASASGESIAVGSFGGIHTDDEAGDDGDGLASVPLAGDMLTMTVAGAEATFGTNATFRFSGDLSSTLLTAVDTTAAPEASGGTPAPAPGATAPEADPGLLHFTAEYGASGWTVDVTPALGEDQAFGLGPAGVLTVHEGDQLRLDLGARPSFTLAGPTLSLPSVMGQEFRLSLDSLRIADQVYISAATADTLSFSLFGQFLEVKATRVGMTYDGGADVFYTDVSGIMETALQKSLKQKCGKPASGGTPASGPRNGCPRNAGEGLERITFENMRFGTDGSFSMGAAQADLLTTPITIIDSTLWFNEMSIASGQEGGGLQLTLGGEIQFPIPEPRGGGGLSTTRPGQNAPKPVAPRADVRFTIDSAGNKSGGEVTYSFDSNPTTPTIGDNPSTEFAMGDRALFEITALAADINLDQPENTAIYMAAGIHLKPRERERDASGRTVVGPSRDPRGRTRYIAFGNAADVRTTPGIKISVADGLALNVDTQGTVQDPLFTFGAGAFNVDLLSVGVSASAGGTSLAGLEVTLGGRASLNMDALEGQFSYSGLTIGTSGITDWGAPDGPMSLSVKGIMDLQVGCFEYEASGATPHTLVTSQRKPGGGDGTAETQSLQVSEYLRFSGNCGPGAPAPAGGDVEPALKVTLASGGFSGGIDEVLYYVTTDDITRFSVQGAQIALAGKGKDALASLYANLDVTSGAGNLTVDVLGVGKVGSIGLGATGTISTGSDGFRFGVFLAADGLGIDLFPLIPGTISLTGVGGGFFYRPTQNNIESVYTLLDNLVDGGFVANNPNGLPEATDLKLAVMLYAGIGLIGKQKYVVDAKGLIMVTDQFMNVDLNGQLLGQGEQLSAGAYLTVQYADPANVVIQGGIRVDVDYSGVIEGRMTIDFDFSPVAWSIYGNADLSVVSLLDFKGEFLFGPPGFAASLDFSGGFDVGIASASGDFHVEFWYINENSDFGAYATANVEAEIVFGAVSASAGIKGALIRETLAPEVVRSLIYGSAYAEVSILGIPTGGTVWVALENGDFDGGFGEETKYTSMVNNARTRAQEMLGLVQKAKTDAQAASAELSALQERIRQQARDAEILEELAREEQPIYDAIGVRLYAIGTPTPETWWQEEGRMFNYFNANWYDNSRSRPGYAAYWKNILSDSYVPPRTLSASGGTPPPDYAELQSKLAEAAQALSTAEANLAQLERAANTYRDEAARLVADLPQRPPEASPLSGLLAADGTIENDGTFAFAASRAEQQRTGQAAILRQTASGAVQERYTSAIRAISEMHDEVRMGMYRLQTSSFGLAMSALNVYYAPRIGRLGMDHFNLSNSLSRAETTTREFERLVEDDLSGLKRSRWDSTDPGWGTRSAVDTAIRQVRSSVMGNYVSDPAQRDRLKANTARAVAETTNLDPLFRQTMKTVYYDLHVNGIRTALSEYATLVDQSKRQLIGHQEGLYAQYRPYTATVDSLFAIQVDIAQSVISATGLYRDWLEANPPPGGASGDIDAEINRHLPGTSYGAVGYQRYAEELQTPSGYDATISQFNLNDGFKVYKATLWWARPPDLPPFLHDSGVVQDGLRWMEVRASIGDEEPVSEGWQTIYFRQLVLDPAAGLRDNSQPPEVCGRVQLRSVGGVLGAVEQACGQMDLNIQFRDQD